VISFRQADLLDMMDLQRGDRVVLTPAAFDKLGPGHRNTYRNNTGTIVDDSLLYDFFTVKWDKPVGTQENTSKFKPESLMRAPREVKADLLDSFTPKPSSVIDIFIELPCLTALTQRDNTKSSSVTIYFNNPTTKKVIASIVPRYLNGRWVVGRQETRIGLNNFWLFDQQNPITKVAAEDQAWKAIRALEALGYKNFATGQEVQPLDNMVHTPTIHVGHMVNDDII